MMQEKPFHIVLPDSPPPLKRAKLEEDRSEYRSDLHISDDGKNSSCTLISSSPFTMKKITLSDLREPEVSISHSYCRNNPSGSSRDIPSVSFCKEASMPDSAGITEAPSDSNPKGNSCEEEVPSDSCYRKASTSDSYCKEVASDSYCKNTPFNPLQREISATSRETTPSQDTPENQLPDDFLEPLPIVENNNNNKCRISAAVPPPALSSQLRLALTLPQVNLGTRQFWKAGDYEGKPRSSLVISAAGGIDHVRVHPKFLHSNATSHKWALGAVAELLDNALDEVSNGATFVNVDMVQNPHDGGPMLIIEDDGGGMNPDRMRQCMSLGYSAKSKSANTIGQYGNGFKTSTMRLGSDVIVFSRSQALKGVPATQSIGLLSYSFLRDTCQEDIIVPMIDYEIRPFGLKKLIRSCVDDWDCNMTTIMKWSPFSTESDLLNQFSRMNFQGTKIILFNLWEDDEGQLELDFESDPYDIQVRGANRDEKKIVMAQRFPNSRHYLTYRHSLRSYTSILYLRLPPGFRIILRGKDVEHHNLVNDLMFTQEHTYKPHGGSDNVQKESNMVAVVTVGFVKDAKDHVDVQGFNVYHKNRLIKPFWRIWNSASSQGRGIIGVLEANFVEPAHDKQGFEKTNVLARLETRLLQMQKTYWSNCCHLIGYYNSKTKKASKTSYSSQRFQSDGLHECGVVTRKRAINQHTSEVPNKYASLIQNEHTSGMPNPHMSQMRNQHKSQMPQPSFRTSSLHQASEVEDQSSTSLPWFGNKDTRTMSENRVEPNYSPNTPVRSFLQRNEGILPATDRNEVDVERFLKEVDKNKHLEAQVSDLEKKMKEIKAFLHGVVQERDRLRQQLEGEIKQRGQEDEDLRKKLKDAYSRIKQLESANRSMVC